MTEQLIKRFLLERAYETGVNIPTFGELHYEDKMYEKLIKGEIQIDESQLYAWLENLKRNKKNFGLYLKSIGCFKDEENITEIADDQEISALNSICIDGNKHVLLAQAGEGCFGKPYKKQIKGHLVIDGIYDNQLIYLSNLFKNKANSFTIGYYGQCDSEYTKRVIQYYKDLRKFLPLMIGQEQIDVIEDTAFNKDKVYVLSYNTKAQIHKPVPVITRHSER